MKVGFILAAGFGKRMQELTADTPKPLLPVDGVPLIYYTLFQLVRLGVRAVVINTHYLAESIEAELHNFPHCELFFSRETERILGTAGGLRHALPLVDLAAAAAGTSSRGVVLANPDTIIFPEAEDRPEPSWLEAADSCLALLPKAAGSTETGWAFHETPAGGDPPGPIHPAEPGDFFYTGLALVDATCVAHLPDNTFNELGPVWKTMGEQGRLRGHVFRGKVVDAGTRTAYDSIQDTEIVPPRLRAEWSQFLARL